MTSQSPRIYIYKITFEEVPYYYYGVHKEKKYDEYYMGSPVTHKWMWKFYTPKKQILQFFDYSDEGWLEAQSIEKRIIKEFYNVGKWCLNENVAGVFSLEVSKRNKDLGIGMFKLTKEERIENGKRYYENKIGIHSLTVEERRANGKKCYELGLGFYSLTEKQKFERSSKGGKKSGKITSSQRWMCLETGHISTPGGLARFQNARGIDTSKRKRIK